MEQKRGETTILKREEGRGGAGLRSGRLKKRGGWNPLRTMSA